MSKLPKTYVKGFHDEELSRCMEYRPLGQTGMEVSVLSFGGGTLSNFYGNLDVDEAIETIHKAIKSGINYFDTAPYYGQGQSEKVLGLAFKNIPREAFYIATKVGRYTTTYDTMFDYSAKKTRASVNESLRLLGLDYVDLIQIHDIEFPETLDVVLNECLPELEKIVKEGKAKFIGVTGYSLDALKNCINLAGPGRFNVVLSYARNTLFDDSLKHYIDFFQSNNLGIICASVHGLGLLTDAGPQSWHPADQELKNLCKKAAYMCRSSGTDLGKLAMQYGIQLKGPATFLTGMQTRNLLKVNLNAYYNEISQQERTQIEQLKECLFREPQNWEGLEVSGYRKALKEMKKQ